jgi:hypothetical protein
MMNKKCDKPTLKSTLLRGTARRQTMDIKTEKRSAQEHQDLSRATVLLSQNESGNRVNAALSKAAVAGKGRTSQRPGHSDLHVAVLQICPLPSPLPVRIIYVTRTLQRV